MTAHISAGRPGSTSPHPQPAERTDVSPCARDFRLDANGTKWRLRSLIAMGHDSGRIARALRVSPYVVRRIVSGQSRTVTTAFHTSACQLWDAWWDKTPPLRTPAERRAAARALSQAKTSNWPSAAALDEDQLDEPRYRPYSRYRPALGTGTAPDFTPAPAGSPDASRSAGRRGRTASDPEADYPRPGTHTRAGLAPATQRARQAAAEA